MTPIIAIDPGASGGIVYRDVKGNKQCFPMPATEGDVLDLLRELSEHLDDGRPVVYMELVRGFIGGKGQPGSAMFNFGMGFGFLKGCIMTLGLKLRLVPPEVWQKWVKIGSRPKEMTKTEWKTKLKGEAQRRNPEVKVTLAISDALLISDYAYMQEIAGG